MKCALFTSFLIGLLGISSPVRAVTMYELLKVSEIKALLAAYDRTGVEDEIANLVSDFEIALNRLGDALAENHDLERKVSILDASGNETQMTRQEALTEPVVQTKRFLDRLFSPSIDDESLSTEELIRIRLPERGRLAKECMSSATGCVFPLFLTGELRDLSGAKVAIGLAPMVEYFDGIRVAAEAIPDELLKPNVQLGSLMDIVERRVHIYSERSKDKFLGVLEASGANIPR